MIRRRFILVSVLLGLLAASLFAGPYLNHRRLAFQPSGGGVSFAHTDSSTGSYTGTTTFSSMSIGTADAGRLVDAITFKRGAGDITGVTIGGVSATLLATASATLDQKTQHWVASVPTGTTADVVVTFDSGSPLCCLSVYALYGYSATPYATQITTGTANPQSVNIAVATDGAVIAGVMSPATGPSCSWTGVTEDVDLDTSTTDTFSSGSTGPDPADASYSVSVSGGDNRQPLAVVSFEPL